MTRQSLLPRSDVFGGVYIKDGIGDDQECLMFIFRKIGDFFVATLFIFLFLVECPDNGPEEPHQPPSGGNNYPG